MISCFQGHITLQNKLARTQLTGVQTNSIPPHSLSPGEGLGVALNKKTQISTKPTVQEIIKKKKKKLVLQPGLCQIHFELWDFSRY